jgi:hypothetical protein
MMPEDRYIKRALCLVSEHLRRYPEMRVSDVYKLHYQACMGPEHAIVNPEAVEQWLMREWASASENLDEEPYEDLSIHHPIYRINLRPAKARNMAPSQILGGFLWCGDTFPKRPEVLVRVWNALSDDIKSGQIRLPDGDYIDEFNAHILKYNYPAIHHSPEYRICYRPAYRLVDKKIA